MPPDDPITRLEEEHRRLVEKCADLGLKNNQLQMRIRTLEVENTELHKQITHLEACLKD